MASRELRNNAAQVLACVEAGEEIVITRRGRPVAELISVRPSVQRWFARSDLAALLGEVSADPAFADELRGDLGGTTDDLGPIE